VWWGVQSFTQRAVEAGYAQMSKVYDETAREFYVGSDDRKHD
jgi:glucose-6-phosphate isomerase